MSRTKEMQRMIRHYCDIHKVTEFKMDDVVNFAVAMGMKLPQPKDPKEILARQFSNAARQEYR